MANLTKPNSYFAITLKEETHSAIVPFIVSLHLDFVTNLLWSAFILRPLLFLNLCRVISREKIVLSFAVSIVGCKNVSAVRRADCDWRGRREGVRIVHDCK